MKNPKYEKKQDKEAQYFTQYILKPLLEENDFISKYKNYTSMLFIKSC